MEKGPGGDGRWQTGGAQTEWQTEQWQTGQRQTGQWQTGQGEAGPWQQQPVGQEPGPATVQTAAEPRPWVRFWARLIDVAIHSLVAGLLIGIVFLPALEAIPDMVVNIVALFAGVFVEAALLSLWGTTVGKWILNIRVADERAPNMTYARALERSFGVWWRGLGAGIPILTLIMQISSYTRLRDTGSTAWDHEGGFVVSHGPVGAGRGLAAAGCVLLIAIMNGVFAS